MTAESKGRGHIESLADQVENRSRNSLLSVTEENPTEFGPAQPACPRARHKLKGP